MVYYTLCFSVLCVYPSIHNPHAIIIIQRFNASSNLYICIHSFNVYLQFIHSYCCINRNSTGITHNDVLTITPTHSRVERYQKPSTVCMKNPQTKASTPQTATLSYNHLIPHIIPYRKLYTYII